MKCETIQDRGWTGLKDIEICKNISNEKVIFVTRDKDFTFLWKKYGLGVIFIAIEPAIIEKIKPEFDNLLFNWNYDISLPFLLKIQNDSTRFWK